MENRLLVILLTHEIIPPLLFGWKNVDVHSPCDRRSADSLRFVCDPQEEDKRIC